MLTATICSLGIAVGCVVSITDGVTEGSTVGLLVTGAYVSPKGNGDRDGLSLGSLDGASLGRIDGRIGSTVG